jgi:phage terminase large subunit
MNRNSREDAVAKKYLARAEADLAKKGWYEDDLCMIVQVNYTENPWFPPELEQERQDDLEMLDEDEYDWIWNGAYNESVEDALIRKKVFDACIDAHKKLGIEPFGQRRAAFDPADAGDDAKGYVLTEGILVRDAGEIDIIDGNEACDWILSKSNQFRADMFVWDGDGLGALLRRDINRAFDGRSVDVRMFKASNAVENPKQVYEGVYKIGRSDTPKTNQETFFNRKAQFAVRLADRMFRTYLWVTKGKHQDPDSIISISSEIKLLDKLRSEVCRLPLKPNPSGKIQLMGKPEMKSKHGIASPNMADCLIMLQQESKAKVVEDIDFTGW